MGAVRSTMQDVPLSISRLLEHGSTIHGTATVATWEGDGARRETFADVGVRAAQLAHALSDLGVTGDQRVATFMFNSAEHLEAYLSVPSMGAVLHTLNLRLPPDQLRWIIDHADDRVVIADGAVLGLIAPVLADLADRPSAAHGVAHLAVVGEADPAVLGAVRAVPGLTVHAYEDLIAGRPTTYAWPEVDERDAAALCYTSGTTGHPKGVLYSHRSIWLHSMQVCMKESFGIDWNDSVLTVVPQFHAMAWGLPYAAFMTGASLLMPSRFLQPEPLVRMIAEERPTFGAAVPTIWIDLLRHLDTHGGDMSSLKEVIVGGSACPPSLMEAFEERHGVTIVHAWGMTETSPLGSVARAPRGAQGERAWSYRVTQGRLPAAVAARLAGPDGAAPADGKAVGELQVRGPWVTGRYHRGDDEERFDDGWLRTGDVASLTPDGYLTITDRAKDVIKSGGEWISSVELENTLMAHPDLVEAAVVGVPDERWGERPLAVIVLNGERPSADAEVLRMWLAERVPRWQVPERWAVVDAVPRTSVGKFDKKLIRARHAEGALDVTVLGPLDREAPGTD
jgi:fatty-acyl-CoA synthase